jgi:hypothetical protein
MLILLLVVLVRGDVRVRTGFRKLESGDEPLPRGAHRHGNGREKRSRCDAGTAAGTTGDRVGQSRTWGAAPEGVTSQGAATIAHGSKAASIASAL